MKIRGVLVDHAMIQRWVYKFTPLIVSEMNKRKGRVGTKGFRCYPTVWTQIFIFGKK